MISFADAGDYVRLACRRVIERAEAGLVRGMRLIEGRIVKDQLSGRPGLNRRTGTAASSWYVHTRRDSSFAAVLSNSPRAWYLRVHQQGATFTVSRGGKSHTVRIPKRLHIPEFFASQQAQQLIMREILASVKQEGGRG